ncbi:MULTISPECIES: AraC family transcriptional regulator [Flavobacteriaceae]|jgi:AraC-like DNA-binding protein|uniref:AraC family transcriptional regulator n=2 Tax=Flavobacteriaceae TaxID=49546 RepID=A0ABN1JP51_9FLAO|nr:MULTISPECIES: AraC family transcriptional regulator [Meridianimaribacter]RYH74072.1 AraC family transcriptional regulator [Flavobacteriaceae bacterium 144Ye]TBV25923.1 AraC family transcriptional regulator [Meridianimaribacter sp. CL38]TDY11292.1 AraC-like DNA-binding protein [Meridianimaribacter flavus]
MCENIHREITQLKPFDVFLVIDRTKPSFDFPIHFHPEYELNFIRNGKGIRRIVGNSMEEIDAIELTLIGSNLEHGWEHHNCTSNAVDEITIQFHDWLFTDELLNLNAFKAIKQLFLRAKEGINFSTETALKLEKQLTSLAEHNNINDYFELFSILQTLADSDDYRLLNTDNDVEISEYENSKKIQLVHDFVHNNYHQKISLDEISCLVNMSTSSFNRFIKKRAGKTFINYVNDVRLIYATKQLINTDMSVSEISYNCGFNNISNFNRIFKKIKKITPSNYRNEFSKVTRFSSELHQV